MRTALVVCGQAGQDEADSSMENFTLEDATNLYGIDGWGAGYFGIGNEGNLVVKPTRDDSLKIDIKVAIDGLIGKNLSTPILLRFPQVLESQVNDLCNSFARAISEFGYNGRYRPVFPIKVNQTSSVVSELLRTGYKFGLGLEAGSKHELLAAIALNASPESLITCNGFKDRDYFRTAFRAAQLGRKIVVVIEKPFELVHYVALAKEHGVRPYVGFRVRLHARGSGKWEKSGGFTSKFGLNTSQLLEGIQELRGAGPVLEAKRVCGERDRRTISRASKRHSGFLLPIDEGPSSSRTRQDSLWRLPLPRRDPSDVVTRSERGGP